MQLNIGTKIKELRRRDGRTQEALAEALGVTNQAVSRWESGGSYPDMEIVPAIANYFHVSIDELFGYNNERSKKIDELADKIDQMNFQNNGEDINIDECISLARNALIEFPGNEKIMLCLASVLPRVRWSAFLFQSRAVRQYCNERSPQVQAGWKAWDPLSLRSKAC